MLLIDYARKTVGLTVGGIHQGRHCGYTTDPDKAEAMRDAGANVLAVGGARESRDVDWPPYTFPSWEISFAIGREVLESRRA